MKKLSKILDKAKKNKRTFKNRDNFTGKIETPSVFLLKGSRKEKRKKKYPN